MSIELLPYVPYKPSPIPVPSTAENDTAVDTSTSELTLSDDERIKLLKFTLHDLSHLLQLNSTEFWSTIKSSETILLWLEGYLLAQAESVTQSLPHFNRNATPAATEMSGLMQRLEAKLLRKVFQIGHRLVTDLKASNGSGEDVVSLPLLMNLSRVYGHTNLLAMGQLWSVAVQDGSWILDELTQARSLFVQTVRSIQKRLEKGVNTKEGGKGKGKSSSSSSSADDEPIDIKAKETRDLDEIRLITDAILSFEAIVLISGSQSESVSDSIIRSSEFVNALVGCYGAINVIAASKIKIVSADETPNASLEFIDGKSGQKATLDPKFAFEIRYFKLAIIALLDALLTVSYFNRMGVEPKSDTSIERPVQIPLTQIASDLSSLTEPLCDLLLLLLDSSPIEEPITSLTSTAPILVDLEVETGVSDRLKSLKEILAQNSPTDGSNARLDFLIVSLEQMIAFSGNILARKERIDERNQRAAEAAERLVASSKKTTKKAIKEAEPAAVDDDYIHRTILISQVHDLFPDLGEGFIEVVKLDRKMPRSAPRSSQPTAAQKKSSKSKSNSKDAWPTLGHADASNVLSERKNIFDNDEFDVFSKAKVDTKKVIWGKKDKTGGLDLDDTSDQKQAVLALHANALQEEEEYERIKREMDEQRMYDDEYDDTYDSSDIKLAGTVELHMLDESEMSVDSSRIKRVHAVDDAEDTKPKSNGISTSAIEQELFNIASGPGKSVFEKTSRKSVARQRLKAKFGWSDEQLEGWFVMFSRNPHQQRALEEKFAWRGNRAPEAVTNIPSNQNKSRGYADSNTQEEEESGDEEEDEEQGGQGAPGASRGGRGGGRGGRGGARGGRANHSRRNQHSKKMARAMGGPV
ncbi:hypothetical protein HDU79_008853 [Rhizoclosmatium sp. JEL0117]|nr:hypothetical protein HDU79_008853 [Rhizoclosmatium sp. JEL0117]